jgi:hypothetical protein
MANLDLQVEHAVIAAREALLAMGRQPVAVHTRGKRPYGIGWQTSQDMPPLVPQALNTGVLCDGIRAIDSDIYDPEAATNARAIILDVLGPSRFIRTRPNSARFVVLYPGTGRKRVFATRYGRVEALGYGQQFVAYGEHPEGGEYEWPDGDPGRERIDDTVAPITDADLGRLEAALRERFGSEPARDPAIPPPTHCARPNGSIYGRVALDGEVATLRLQTKGGRNDQLNSSAFSLGQLVAGGELGRPEVESALRNAAIENGLASDDGIRFVDATIKSGLDAGAREPRARPGDRLDLCARQPWPEPKPLPDGLAPVAPFDTAFLPASIAPWIADIAERMQCPPDFVAVPALIALGATLGRKIGVRPQRRTDWTEVPNLWGCIVGRPGMMKSPAMSEALKPLHRLEAKSRKEHAAALKKYAREFELYKLTLDEAKAAAKKALKAGDEPLSIDIEEPEKPTARRYVVNDTTYEALGEILADNPNGVLAFRDELVSLLKTLDQEEDFGRVGRSWATYKGSAILKTLASFLLMGHSR